MHDIDFLPVEYRRRQARNKRQVWGSVAVTVMVGLIVTTAWFQHRRYRHAEDRLATILPEHEATVDRSKRLDEMHAQLNSARAGAELYTYLRHPWPRTRIINAILKPLPEEITFDELQISRETPSGATSRRRAAQADRQTEKEELSKLLPTARDLKKLRDEFDPALTVVKISGVTNRGDALHRYLGELNDTNLFTKAELDNLESDRGDRSRMLRFTATVTVRPGYGQPGGPNVGSD
jgi:Tfp pilus assembly protein PilN